MRIIDIYEVTKSPRPFAMPILILAKDREPCCGCYGSYFDLFQPYGGFPDGVKVIDGHITMSDLPGIGFEGKSDLIKVMRDLAQ
jgi:hypothetical protein